MSFILAIIGAITGLVLGSGKVHGLVFMLCGGFIGYLLGRIDKLQREINGLNYRLDSAQYQDRRSQTAAGDKAASAAQTPDTGPTVSSETEITKPATLPVVARTLSAPSTVTESTPEPVSAAEAQPSSKPKTASEPAPVETAEAKTDATTPPPVKLSDHPVIRFFVTGNTFLKLGIVVLFFGVSFLLKYAIEHRMVVLPVEGYFIIVALSAIGFLALGWRLRNRDLSYGLGLQGAGIGILYLTIVAALRSPELNIKITPLIGHTPAFVLLVVVCILSAALAIRQNARTLAILGTLGGFLAPVLTSSGSNQYMFLFSFYAVLNLGIITIALAKSWRELNLVGFFCTFGIGLLWGFHSYLSTLAKHPAVFYEIEGFLILFFLMYLIIPILYATRQTINLKGYVDSTLVVGTPLVAFSIQALLMHHHHSEYGLAISALCLALVYVVLSYLFIRTRNEKYGLYTEVMLITGLVFTTVAIPLAVDHRWTSAAWALEGAAILWIGIRQQHAGPRLFGMIVQVLSIGAFLRHFERGEIWNTISTGLPATGAPIKFPVLNGFFLGVLMIFFALIISAWLLRKHRDKISTTEVELRHLFMVGGLVTWFAGGLFEIHRFASDTHKLNIMLLYSVFSTAMFYFIGQRLKWQSMMKTIATHFVWLALFCILAGLKLQHPFANTGYLYWLFGLTIYYLTLRHADTNMKGFMPAGFFRPHHFIGYMVIGILLILETHWWLTRITGPATSWADLPVGMVASAMLFLVTVAYKPGRWPFSASGNFYPLVLMPLTGVVLLFWSFTINLQNSGNFSPLPYIPAFNPIDLIHGFLLFCAYLSYRALKRHDLVVQAADGLKPALIVLGIAVFVWINAVLLRTFHHWGSIPYELNAMLKSVKVQMAISIYWTTIAITTMYLSNRRGSRPWWIIGSSLLGLVVIKLFILDLANTGTIERSISFTVVGLLIILIAYYAPLPPRNNTETELTAPGSSADAEGTQAD